MRKAKNNIIIISYIFTLLVIFISCSGEEATVKYLVYGTADTAKIEYITTRRGDIFSTKVITLENENLPWEYEYKAYNKASDENSFVARVCTTKLVSDETIIYSQIYINGHLKEMDENANFNEEKCIQVKIYLDGVED